MINGILKQHLEKYHNSKIKELLSNPVNLTVVIIFENGEKTCFGFLTTEKINFLNPNYETFVEFYEEHIETIKRLGWLD